MNETIRGHNPKMMVVMALVAVLLVLTVALVFALQPAATTSGRDASTTNQAMSAEDTGGSTITEDPYIERHAEVVERLGNGSLR
jgi:cytochrome c oxidase assembly factor CtaG